METTKQKAELRELVTRLYQECGVMVVPTKPKVLVRVLPKEQKLGSLWLPDGKNQNKPTWEGIVLAVYEPYFQKVYIEDVDWVPGQPDPEVAYTQKVECEVQPGDHVLFPHIEYGVVPVWPLDGGVGDYRLIPEGIIMSTVEYAETSKRDWLLYLLDPNDSDFPEHVVDKILENADIIRKDVKPVILSGK